jgi:Double zinc ribbon
MLTLAYFGIESSGLNLVIDLLILFVAVLYLSLIYWTYADARRRILDPMLVGCATAASLFPFVGTIVYMILRPPEYLEDVHERELEMQAAEARLHELDTSLCPHCDYRIERDFVRCPSCLRKLKERCVSCSRPLDQAWTICPYCETEVASAPARRTRRRRATVDAEPSEAAASAPEKRRAKPARERAELETVADAAGADPVADEQDTRPTPLAASEPAVRPRGGTRSGRRPARPST